MAANLLSFLPLRRAIAIRILSAAACSYNAVCFKSRPPCALHTEQIHIRKLRLRGGGIFDVCVSDGVLAVN